MFGGFKRKSVTPDMGSLSSGDLIAVCDRWWFPPSVGHAEFVRAYNELTTRGPEIRDWCRRLLDHPDYEAREVAAHLLGRLGARRQLAEATEAVIAELGALTRRPVEVDGKAVQAVDAALGALAEIGQPAGIPHVRAVLFSDDKFLAWDTQWSAAEALARLTGQPFMKSPDPPGAARGWLLTHQPPDAGGA